MKKFLIIMFGLLAPALISAQYYDDGGVAQAQVADGPHYFVGILAGVLIAIGLQLLLTNLSLASGMSVFGPLDKKYRSGRRRSQNYNKNFSGNQDAPDNIRHRKPNAYDIYTAQTVNPDPISTVPPMPLDPGMSAGGPAAPGYSSYVPEQGPSNVKTSIDKKYTESAMDKAHDTVRTIASGFGIWSLVTSSIALFFASWLAVELSLTVSNTIGAIIGLTIWSLFFVTVTLLELTAFSSLAGSLLNTAMSGLKSVKNTVSSIFTKSDASKAADMAQEITRSVINEFQRDVNTRQVKKQLQAWVNDLKPNRFEPKDIRHEIEKLLDHTDIDVVAKSEGPLISADEVEAHFKRHGVNIRGNAKSLANSINDAIHQIKESRGQGTSKASSYATAGMGMMGVSPEKVESIKQKLGDYLRMTENSQLDPDAIQGDLERMFSDPKGGFQALRDRVATIDKETIVKFVYNVDGLSEDQARNYVNKVETAINKILGRSGGQGGSDFGGAGSQYQAYGGKLSEGVLGQEQQGEGSANNEGIKQKILSWLNTHTPGSVNVEDWLHDFGLIFSDPKEGFDSSLARLRSVDRQTLTELVSMNSNMSPEDVNSTIDKIESYRDSLIQKYEDMKQETYRRIEQAKNQALHQAEEVRKTAAVAAWWAFGMALVSGVAAVVGGMVGAGI